MPHATHLICDRESDRTLSVTLLVRPDGSIECGGEEAPIPAGTIGLLADVTCGTVSVDRMLVPTAVSVWGCFDGSDREVEIPDYANLADDGVMQRAEAAICIWMEDEDLVFDD